VDQGAPFSGVSVILEIVEDLVTALRGREDDRALSAAEAAQLDKLELLRDALRLALPRAQSAAFMSNIAVVAPLLVLFECASAATQSGIPMPDLLGMTNVTPRRARWRPLALSMESLAWLGVTRIADDLRLICQVGAASTERQRQLALMRDLQSGLSTLIELDARHRRFHQANARVQAGFADGAKIVGDHLPAIRAEAAAIRARSQ